MMDTSKGILVFLRVSTEAQELDEQKEEMRAFCLQHGYSQESIIYVEGRGASAIAMNELYLQMYEDVKRYIDSRTISAVAVWSVNRLARDEEFFVRFKKLFIENGIQLLVKNPTLALLNPDGSVNAGNELALSLFSTMAKQEMAERKAKFSRTKRAYARQGKWSGGRTKKFGYRVDEHQYFVEDENDAAIVRLIFELYATGLYSASTLNDELLARGLVRSDGLPINPPFITRILGCASYYGAPDLRNHSRVYPPLITETMFLKCREVAARNRLEMRRGERVVLSSRLIRCSFCGGSYTSNSRHLRCCRSSGRARKCSNNLMIRQSVADEILWRVASKAHEQYLREQEQERLAQCRAQMEAVSRRIAALESRVRRADQRRRRIVSSYVDGCLDERERDLRLAKVSREVQGWMRELDGLRGGAGYDGGLLGMADGVGGSGEAASCLAVTEQEKYDIIHKHILKATAIRTTFGRRDPRARGDNAVLFEVLTAAGERWRILYVPKRAGGGGKLVWEEEGKM